MLDKIELRKIYVKKREDIYLMNGLDNLSSQIFLQFRNSQFLSFNKYHIFLPIKENYEINTFLFIDYLFFLNKTIVVPKIKNNEIESYIYNKNTTIEKNKWNILEPRNSKISKNFDIDLVIIPLLICDYLGNRIGYGKGFYDRFLKKCNSKTIKVGINFFEPLEEKINNETNDVPIDYLITPSRIVSFFPKEVK